MPQCIFAYLGFWKNRDGNHESRKQKSGYQLCRKCLSVKCIQGAPLDMIRHGLDFLYKAGKKADGGACCAAREVVFRD